MLEERESDSESEVPVYPDRQYIWGADGQLLLADRGQVIPNPNRSVRTTRYYPLHDGHGNITGLIEYDETDKSAVLAGRFG